MKNAVRLTPTRTKKEQSRFAQKEEIYFDNNQYKLEITPYFSSSKLEKMFEEYTKFIGSFKDEISDDEFLKHYMTVAYFLIIKHFSDYYTSSDMKKLDYKQQFAHYSMLHDLGYLMEIMEKFPEEEIDKVNKVLVNTMEFGIKYLESYEEVKGQLDKLENPEVLDIAAKVKKEKAPKKKKQIPEV